MGDFDDVSDVKPTKNSTKKSQKRATYEEYVQLLNDELGELRRDVFTGDLHHKNLKSGKWLPVLGEYTLGNLRSLCRETKGYFSPASLEDHILRLTFESPGKMLVDIPDWDGGERLNEIGRCLKCRNLSQEHVTEFIKDWGARMFRRLYDPVIENRILILKGDQGAGKDYLVRQMLGALGDYLVPFIVFHLEKDTIEQLCSGLVMHLAEYDRTNKTDVAALKNYITMNKARFRPSHAKKAENRAVRSSFIASCNVDNILRDYTGNRRYIILDIEKILWEYPLGDSAQILAEWKKLSSEGYRASDEAEAAMREFVSVGTPPDPEEEICSDYMALFEKHYPTENSRYSSLMPEVWKDLSRMHNYSIQALRSILKRKGYTYRDGGGIKYYKRLDLVLKNDDSDMPF